MPVGASQSKSSEVVPTPLAASAPLPLNRVRPATDLSAQSIGPKSMPTRRTIILGAARTFSTAIAGSARAEDTAAALAFVKAIYAPYKGKNTKGITLDTDDDLRRYFEPSLVALISKDEKDAARRRDVPTLDGDPFIDAQDWETPSFDITVSDAG